MNASLRERRNEEVVVSGIGIVCGLGIGKMSVLSGMLENRSGIGRIQSFDTGALRANIGAEVRDFDPTAYFSSVDQERYDRCAQLAIVAATEALEESGLALGKEERNQIGVVLGTCNGGILSLEHQRTVDPRLLELKKMVRFPSYYQAESVARHFGLGGAVITINTACAASGNAIGLAADLVRLGYVRAALAGGADAMSMLVYAGFNALQALKPTPCSPYGIDYGLTLGEGSGFLVLESARSARERGARVYTQICGYGLSNDAHHPTAPDPDGEGIAFATKLGLRRANVEPNQIGYINSHGTGTKANDAAELRGLQSALTDEHFARIPISSSKSYFGHTLGAAASIEYISTLLAQKEDLLPATLHVTQLREGCERSLLITNQMRPGRPTYFLCNNSAFGGHNVALVSRNLKVGQTAIPTAPASSCRVAIVGTGCVGPAGAMRGELLAALLKSGSRPGKAKFALREFAPHLYERRMNRLTQMAIAAAQQALEDSGVHAPVEAETYEVGVIFGTAYGALESFEKYTEPIFASGPEQASTVYFPDTVLNSTAGRLAQKLRLKGYSSSLSTGGHDGLVAAMYGCQCIQDGIHGQCLVGAGEELCNLGSVVQRAEGWGEAGHPVSEGAGFLMLRALDQARARGNRIFGELLGFGLAFSSDAGRGEAVRRAVETALATASVRPQEIGTVLLSTPGRDTEQELCEAAVRGIGVAPEVPTRSFDDRLGYVQSLNALLNIQFAAEIASAHEQVAENLAPCSRVLVLSQSINGGFGAVVVGRVEPD